MLRSADNLISHAARVFTSWINYYNILSQKTAAQWKECSNRNQEFSHVSLITKSEAPPSQPCSQKCYRAKYFSSKKKRKKATTEQSHFYQKETFCQLSLYTGMYRKCVSMFSKLTFHLFSIPIFLTVCYE